MNYQHWRIETLNKTIEKRASQKVSDFLLISETKFLDALNNIKLSVSNLRDTYNSQRETSSGESIEKCLTIYSTSLWVSVIYNSYIKTTSQTFLPQGDFNTLICYFLTNC